MTQPLQDDDNDSDDSDWGLETTMDTEKTKEPPKKPLNRFAKKQSIAAMDRLSLKTLDNDSHRRTIGNGQLDNGGSCFSCFGGGGFRSKK